MMAGLKVCGGLRRDGAGRIDVLAPAKINLTLDVLGRRPDGFHELASLVVGVAFYDELTLAASGEGIEIQCDQPSDEPGLPTDSRNLAWRAAEILSDRVGRRSNVRITLSKRIPQGAGLGGGSSDAAATLAGLNALWRCDLNGDALSSLGSRIGSDVPLFFHLPAAFMRGRGDLVERVECSRSHVVLLIMPEIHVSTAEVYGHWEAGGERGVDRSANWADLLAGPTSALAERMFNSLEPAIFRACTAVKALFEHVQGLGLKHVRVSGSGATMFALFEDEEEAKYWSKCISGQPGVKTVVTRTLTVDDYY